MNLPIKIKKEVQTIRENTRNTEGKCNSASDLATAIICAAEAKSIIGFNEKWPAHTNSTQFFRLIANNQNLKKLSFCYVQIDSLPSSIGKLSSLEYLHLSGENITKIPREIGQLKHLKVLDFGNSEDECMGSPIKIVPKEIGECASLEKLCLAFSEVQNLPAELEKCKNLKTIDLSFNKFLTKARIEELKTRFPEVEFIVKQE